MYASLYNWKTIFLIVAKNTNVIAKKINYCPSIDAINTR